MTTKELKLGTRIENFFILVWSNRQSPQVYHASIDDVPIDFITSFSREDFNRYRGFGKKSLSALERSLDRNGLALRKTARELFIESGLGF